MGTLVGRVVPGVGDLPSLTLSFANFNPEKRTFEGDINTGGLGE